MARTQLSLATFNLYNLNQPTLPMYRNAGWDQAVYDRKIAWSAEIIGRLRADVWGFQELWHADSLTNVFDQSGLAGEYSLLVPDGQAGQRIVCAAAVRSDILIGEPEWIDVFPEQYELSSRQSADKQMADIAVQLNRFSRPVLHFEIKPRSNGERIHVYVCHLKSKRPTDVFREAWYSKPTHAKHQEAIGATLSTIRRSAEALALRIMLTERMKDAISPVIVLGDINDGEQSNTLNILSGQPNYILSGLNQGGSDIDLYSVGALKLMRSQRNVQYTHIFQNVLESLDNILVSEEFYDNSRKRIWAFKEMTIENDHLNADDHKQSGTSDHGVVKAMFEYRPNR